MRQIVLVGLAAGSASALLFSSIVSGSLLSILLFYVSALPIMIAAIGWSHLAGLIAAAAAATVLASIFGAFFFFAFLIGVGLPAWLLGYLALLARTSNDPASPGHLEWYPAGHLVFWCALLGAIVVIATLPDFGWDTGSLRSDIKKAIEGALRARMGSADGPVRFPGMSDIGYLVDVILVVFPAVGTAMVNIVNLWLAGRIVDLSGRLRRPWPYLPGIAFPSYAPIVFAGAVIATFAPAVVGLAGSAVAATLLSAYAILGLAVLHAVTVGMKGRPAILAGTYVGIAVLGWPMLAAAMLGLFETMFDLRARRARRHSPPSS